MLSRFLEMIGVSEELAQRVGEADLLWTHPVLLVIGLVLVPVLGWLIHRRHAASLPHVSPRLRGLLTFCRVALLLILVVILCGPRLRLEQPVEHRPIVALLVDVSDSMALPAGSYPDDAARRIALAAGLVDDAEQAGSGLSAEVRKTLDAMSRSELAQRVLRTQRGALLDALEERFDLRAYRFARGVEQQEMSELIAESVPHSDADADIGPRDTALGQAIARALDDAGGREVAAVVVLSDGRSTAGDDPVSLIRRRAARAADREVPDVWTVPIGSGLPLTDVGVVDALAPRRLAAGDTATVIATIASHGYDGRAVPVRLLEGDDVLDEQDVVLRSGERQQVQLTINTEDAGVRQLAVAVGEELASDRVPGNDRHRFTIEVDEEQWRVLYLEGYPRWDFRFLDHALRRDHGLDATVVVEASLRAGDVAPADLPTAANLPQDAEGWAEYHAVLLGDVSPDLLGGRGAEQLARAVRDSGVGLIVQAGTQDSPHDWAGTPLAELLPLRLDASANEDDDGPGLASPVYAPFVMEVTASGSMHPAFRLYDSARRNRATWSRMPPLFWAGAFEDPRPGATVLAELDTAEGKRPLIADHLAGRGRVLLIGFDATYSWRRNVGDHLFNRFWGQAIRHVARSRERSEQSSWLDAYPSRVEPGESVVVELFAVDADGRPVRGEQQTAEVRRDGSVETVTLSGGGDAGRYRGVWRAAQRGQYRVTHVDTSGDVLRSEVWVVEGNRETVLPEVDRDTLGNLADASGGRLVELYGLAELPDRLAGETETVLRVREAELWDNWFVLVLLVLLYCTDVAVRRMSGLS
ncbi:MAG: hypothetical protein ACOC1G_04135 [Phycisphaeraceae bacterium]